MCCAKCSDPAPTPSLLPAPHPQQGFLQPIACRHHSPGTKTNGTPWEKLTPPWTKLTPPWTFFPTASISGGAAERENGVLRKKCHVVRKKNHVVRKLFYVASIFSYAKGRFTCGAARGPHGLPRAESGAAAPICCKDVLTQAVRRRRHNQVRKNRFHHRVTLKYEYFRTFACPTT